MTTTLKLAELEGMGERELGTSDWVEITQVMGVNYGVEKIRFTNPVPVGSRVRLHAKLLGSDAKGGGRLNRIGVQLEIDGEEKPAMVGEVLFLAFGASDA